MENLIRLLLTHMLMEKIVVMEENTTEELNLNLSKKEMIS